MTDYVPARAPTMLMTSRAVLVGARPKQWLKNGFLLAAAVFAGRLSDPTDLAKVAWAVVIFCLISSAGYLLNDILDVERDRRHPVKCRRPLASGRLSAQQAAVSAIVLAAAALLGAALLGRSFLLVTAAYGVFTVSYSLGLKYLVLVDVVAIATGFVIRSVAGAVAIAVPVSIWLGVLTVLVAMFIVFGKRRSDMMLMGDEGRMSSATARYTIQALDTMIAATGLATMAVYVLYAVLALSLPADHSMLITVPFVAFGLIRYLYFIRHHEDAGAPEEVLLRDVPLLASLLGWAICTALVLYWIQ